MPVPTSKQREALQDDLRVRRTRRLLTQALVNLTTERSFETITVRELTDRAQVGYATFFRHYTGIDDLLRSAVEDLLVDLQELVLPLTGDPERAGTLLFRHAGEHAGLYRLLLRTDRSLNLISGAVEAGIQRVRETFEVKPCSNVPLEIAANHLIRATIGLLEWWLDNGSSLKPERMGEIYRDLILSPVLASTLRPRTVTSPPPPA